MTSPCARLALSSLSLSLALSLGAFAHDARAEPVDAPSVEAPTPPSPEPAPKRVRSHRLGIAGASALAQAYTLGAWIAAGALVYCAASAEPNRGCSMKPPPGAFRELFIPLAGPWVALRRDTVHGDAKYALLFGALGSVQAAGLALLVYDLAAPRYTLEPATALRVLPVAHADTLLLSAVGRF